MSPLYIVAIGWSVLSECKYFILLLGRMELEGKKEVSDSRLLKEWCPSFNILMLCNVVLWLEKRLKQAGNWEKNIHLYNILSCGWIISENSLTWVMLRCISAGHACHVRLFQHQHLMKEKCLGSCGRPARVKTHIEMLWISALFLPTEKGCKHRGRF